jgi:protein YIPF5/7
MSRPVGNYYSSGGVTTTQAPVAATASSSDWDWGTQTKADTTDWSNPSGGTSQDPTGATSTATSDKDWYSGTSVSSSNAHVVASAAPSPYATPGFANGGSSSAAGNTSSSYSSFNPSIQHNQQQPMQAGTGFYQHPSQAPREQQHSLLSGVMDSGAMNTGESSAGGISSAPAYSMFVPKPQSTDSMMDSSYLPMDEAPLLEELGVNTDHILLKTKAVVLPFSRFGGNALEPEVICKDADLAGPIAFALLLGAEMIFSGKLQFGYIYGFGLFGCIAMTFVVNLVAPHNPISFWTVTSILGYSLLPVNLLALIKIFVINLINLQTLGRLLGIVTVAWSTTASTRLFELGCQLRSQRYLIAYPIALLYSAFVLITIF